MNALPLEQYNLVDLPEVIALAERFLTALDTAGDIRYIDGTHLYRDLPCDLVISNYAFSELIKPVQDIYINRIIRAAPRRVTSRGIKPVSVGAVGIKATLWKNSYR